MSALKKLCAAIIFASFLLLCLPIDGSASDIYERLKDSRDALLAQEREIQRSYDDVARQVDELHQKQSLLDSYLNQTRSAIREVERAMGTSP
jgi:septal ring factor EnvC (AmiA/AmiB activator)